jgi:hypothetical protein
MAAATRSAMVSSTSRVTISVRGVISSAAVREPNCSERSTSVAVTGSSDPRRAELRTNEPSSCGERAERSSSAGSMPSRRRIQLAVPLVKWINGVNIIEKSTCGPATARATGSGLATARYWATSSPNTIDTDVAINSASTNARPLERSWDNDIAVKTGSSSRATSGSAR